MSTATISASQVKELREKTGVGMMQCKKALAEANGDIEKAIENLRKAGAAVAAKRAGKEANEGKVILASNSDKIVIIEVNCETDFVANGDDFQAFSKDLETAVIANDVQDVDALKATSIGDLTVETKLSELSGKLGEKIDIKRINAISLTADNVTAAYSHLGGKIGVALVLEKQGDASDAAALETLAKDLAMQVAATNPLGITSDEIPADVIEKERGIYKELAIQAGTKEEFVDRQIEGKVKKFLKENCLVEQMFVKDSKLPVNKLLDDTAKSLGLAALKVAAFTRFELGK